jgi:hypothetical protein
MKVVIGIITALYTMWIIDNVMWIVKLPPPANVFLVVSGVISGVIVAIIFINEAERLWGE